MPGTSIDVTELVRSKATSDGVLVIPTIEGVAWTTWGGLGDPAPGVPGMKELVLSLLINGQTFTRTFPENVWAQLDYAAVYASGDSTSSLPPPPPLPIGGGVIGVTGPLYPNMEPDQIAAYQAWLSAGAVGSPPDWVFVDRAAERQRAADAAAALAIIANLPPELRATYDLGGTGYGSAQQIVLAANPGASAVDILAQAVQLQIVADAAGVLPAEVVAQQPGAAVIGTTTDPSTITPPAGGSAAGNNVPLDPSGNPVGAKKGKTILWLVALGAGAWMLSKRRKAA